MRGTSDAASAKSCGRQRLSELAGRHVGGQQAVRDDEAVLVPVGYRLTLVLDR